ncbi:hypothetical protein KNP414_05248 [Paenibacillus mucilaginosus KNP414]|uniref:Uncharacterized protein n=1 Tax=Paenibacillus mucilaginosus (strain KNP414) TaxID=1036673 RepID=F8FC11_PAEMK|nr:hypothetical protein KNP414_05248 [Paenibacillus mucilaginosus KNP414]
MTRIDREAEFPFRRYPTKKALSSDKCFFVYSFVSKEDAAVSYMSSSGAS